MPGVASDPPSNGALRNGLQNGATRSLEESTVLEIKNKAKESVQREARGFSALTLIKSARLQLATARDSEVKGDLRTAFSSYIKAATLAKMTMDSQDYAIESKGKGGAIRQELNDFLNGEGQNIATNANAIEEKLRSIEQQNTANPGVVDLVGKSIADRLRALQDSGMQVPTPKAPETSIRMVNGGHLQTPAAPVMTPSTSTSSTLGHTFVSPATLGPPSPPASPPNSSADAYDLSGFASQFPSIDELDADPAFSLPSVPTTIPQSISKSFSKSSQNGDVPLPIAPFKSFASQIERPSSAPITPTVNTFSSRPGSPSSRPFVPSKPSGLSNGTSTPRIPVTNAATPKDLKAYMQDYEVLIIDVRNRADFDRGHIKGAAVICIEPAILLREGITSEDIENALVVGPRQEHSLFMNRDKFSLVVVYDEQSTLFGSEKSPMNLLVRIIHELAFKKMLKRMPMLLVGGIEAWRREIGDSDIVRGDPGMEVVRAVPKRDPSPTTLPSSPNPNNPFTNGVHVNHTGGSHQIWTPKQRPDGLLLNGPSGEHRSTMSVDQSHHSRSVAENLDFGNPTGLSRRAAISRPPSGIAPRAMHDPVSSLPAQLPSTLSSTSIVYPQFSKHVSPPSSAASTSTPALSAPFDITSPPIASLNPSSHASRRRGDFVDQSQEALSSLNVRSPIDYPDVTSPSILRPPPVATSTLERQGIRPRMPLPGTLAPRPPRIESEYPVSYWGDVPVGVSGLKNMGNTCYMNAPIQCLSATAPFAKFFTDGRWKNAINFTNPLGSKGRLTQAFAKLVHQMWGETSPYLIPNDFRRSICGLNPQYEGSDQHDSQEFLSFLLDGVHEDLNRILAKPPLNPTPEEEAFLETLPPQIASEREWQNWKSRNDSLIVDYFQGQFRSRLQCLTCEKTSTTYNVFSILQLPVPKSRKPVTIDRCLGELLNEEVLDKDDSWDCPRCKTKRRATKKLTLARLPPVLVIHLKRFEANARSADKIDTFVDFPMQGFDLTNHMPPPLPPGADRSELNGGLPMAKDDPRNQIPPYRYDLYAVTNHYGNLGSGHYTAFIHSSAGWMLCDDSQVETVKPKRVVNQQAYVLFYKRVRT